VGFVMTLTLKKARIIAYIPHKYEKRPFAADPAAFLCKTGAWIKLPEKHLRGQAIRAWSAAVNLPAIAVDIWENPSYNID